MRDTAASSSPSSGRGSMRIAGASITSAPRPASRAARPLAWARARVTATTSPCSGRRSSQASVSRRPATGPISVIEGGRIPSASTRAGQPGQRVDDRALPRQGAALDHRRGLAGIPAGRDQPLGDQRQVLHAHVEDERPGEARERLPVERRLGLLRILVAGDEGDRRGGVAVRDRDARVGGRRDPGRHARHDLERDPGGGQRLGLLAAAPEHERVAALEADDALARPAPARRAAR